MSATHGANAYGPRPIGVMHDDITAQQRHVEHVLAQAQLLEQLPGDDPDYEAVLVGDRVVIERRIAGLLNGASAARAPERAWETLDEISDAPAEPLLLGMVEPDGPTILNAAGGVGKGTTGSWLISELLGIGLRTLIFDAEQRPREWARRLSGLGVDRRQVAYVRPKRLPTNLMGAPLWDVIPHLGQVMTDSRSDVLFIDSIMAALGVGEDRLKSDAQIPYLVVSALDDLGRPNVSFTHPPKGQPNGDPFGSVAWVNAPRLVWQGTTAESATHRVRWRSRKRNERGRIPGLLLSFGYDELGLLASAERADDEEATREWIVGTLLATSLTIDDMADLLSDEMEDEQSAEARRRTEERLGRTLRRLAKEGEVRKDGKVGKADRWTLDVVSRT